MKGKRGVWPTCLLALWLPGCGSLFGLSRHPEEAFERRERILAEAEAAEVERLARSREGAPLDEILRDADGMARTGRMEQALMGYLDALQADPRSPVPRARIANLQLSRDPERAEALFRDILASEPEAAIAHAGLGLALLARNRVEEAEAPLLRALELDPLLANAHTGLSVVYDLEGRYAEAQRHALAARELAPRDATIANNLGVSYLLSRDFAAAEEAFRQAALLTPNDPAVRNNLGISLGRQGRYDEALEQFRRTGSEQAAHNNLGYVYLLDGHLDEAIAEFEHALEAEGDQDLVVLRNLNAAIDAREGRDRGSPARLDLR